MLFNMFANVLAEDQCLGEIPAYRREPFGSLERTRAALVGYPRISKIVTNIGSNPEVQKFLAMRGKQGF